MLGNLMLILTRCQVKFQSSIRILDYFDEGKGLVLLLVFR